MIDCAFSSFGILAMKDPLYNMLSPCFVVDVYKVTRLKSLSSNLVNFYCLALFEVVANGLVVDVEMVSKLNDTKTTINNVYRAYVLGG